MEFPNCSIQILNFTVMSGREHLRRKGEILLDPQAVSHRVANFALSPFIIDGIENGAIVPISTKQTAMLIALDDLTSLGLPAVDHFIDQDVGKDDWPFNYGVLVYHVALVAIRHLLFQDAAAGQILSPVGLSGAENLCYSGPAQIAGTGRPMDIKH